jgi:low temperature requirement protein LtrA
VFVVAIAELSHELVVNHTLGGFATFAALFVPVFVAWQGFSFYADRFDTDDVLFRVSMLIAMLAVAALAIQIPGVTHGASTGFALAYVAIRSLTVALNLRAYRHVSLARPLIGRYVVAFSFSVALWTVSLAVPEPWRFLLWGIGLAADIGVPALIGPRFVGRVPLHASHIPERFAPGMLASTTSGGASYALPHPTWLLRALLSSRGRQRDVPVSVAWHHLGY